ncbi:hypothetical protein F5Y10DRAFT_70410 [Nemania abortiva]|nr:hypothetical protein F5Y10DRAFT_70410 [Nemania abortiva]
MPPYEITPDDRQGIIAIPPPPDLLDSCIFLGVDPHTGLMPVFVRSWTAGDAPNLTRQYLSANYLGYRTYLRTVMYKVNAKCQVIPPVAFYRSGTLAAEKARSRPLASSDASSSPPPQSSFVPDCQSIWKNAGPFYLSDHPITWLPTKDDLKPPSIHSIKWNLTGLGHPHDDHPFDLIPAFSLDPMPPFSRLLHTCAHLTGHHQMAANTLYYLAALWAHYKLLPEDHHCYGAYLLTTDVPSLRHFALQVPRIVADMEEWGYPWYPHLARASMARRSFDPEWPFATEQFKLLEASVLTYFREHSFQTVGHITPGDVGKTKNDTIRDLHQHRLFREDASGSRRQAIRSTAEIFGTMIKDGLPPDVNVSPRRPNLPTSVVNNWRHTSASSDATTSLTPRVRFDIPSTTPPHKQRLPSSASVPPHLRPAASSHIPPHLRAVTTSSPAPPPASSDAQPARRPQRPFPDFGPRDHASSDAPPARQPQRPFPDCGPRDHASSDAIRQSYPPLRPSIFDDPEYHYGRPKFFELIAQYRRERKEELARYVPPPDSPGKPGTKRKPGETKSARRRSNKDKANEVKRGWESASDPGSDEPRVGPESIRLPDPIDIGLPRAFAGDADFHLKVGDECFVCRDLIEEGSELMKLTCCGKEAHWECLGYWFAKHRDKGCPTCRDPLSDKWI